MYVDDRVVVEGRLGRRPATGEIEVMLPRILPPRRERLLMVVGAVFVVEEPQTEARAGQSEWPDLGVLSMAANGRRFPLPIQKCGYRGVGPTKGMLAVANHLERLVPPLVAIIGWRWVFPVLALGPVFGIASIRRLVAFRAARIAT